MLRLHKKTQPITNLSFAQSLSLASLRQDCLPLELALHRCTRFHADSPVLQMLGKCLAGLPREQIVVATKVGRYGAETFDFSAERVTASVHESLARLQLTYIDVIQCHDIEFGSLDQVCARLQPCLRRVTPRYMGQRWLRMLTHQIMRLASAAVQVGNWTPSLVLDSTESCLLAHLMRYVQVRVNNAIANVTEAAAAAAVDQCRSDGQSWEHSCSNICNWS